MCANILVINKNPKQEKEKTLINQFVCFVVFSSIVILVLAYEMFLFLTS